MSTKCSSPPTDVLARSCPAADATMIRPSHLPRVRDRMVTLLSDPTSALRRRPSIDSEHGLTLDIVARHLASGRMYWVSGDMAALATAAGRELDTVRWTSADRPAAAGLMVIDGGVGWLSRPAGGDFPVDAISWGPAPDGLLLSLWVARQRLDDNLARQGAHVDPEQIPHLVPMLGYPLPISADYRPAADIPAEFRTLATTLAAAWHLMYQPILADRRRAEVDRAIRRAYARADRPEPEVTIVDLRALYRPTDPDHEPRSEPGRYSHRWVVTGHWRNQAHGPGLQLRKRIWIPDYIKGPDGAPLLIHERVNVWRR